jgi:hypothetical protein
MQNARATEKISDLGETELLELARRENGEAVRAIITRSETLRRATRDPQDPGASDRRSSTGFPHCFRVALQASAWRRPQGFSTKRNCSVGWKGWETVYRHESVWPSYDFEISRGVSP